MLTHAASFSVTSACAIDSACCCDSHVTKTIILSVICCYDLPMTKIKFGTSGWRAIIADEFTFSNVRLATEAIGRWVRRRTASPTILVGYDTRFASENFGREVARVLSSQNIRAKLCSQAVPTPGVAFTVVSQKLDGAINITASHDPGEYKGLKFSASDGDAALAEVTSEIERAIARMQDARWECT